MPHTIYNNFVLEQKAESALISKLNAQNYMTVDTTLTATDGLKHIVHTYKTTGAIEDLAEGEGNTGEISVTFTPVEYTVKTAQGIFNYSDEQALTDSFAIDQLLVGTSEQMANSMNAKFFTELGKATKTIEYGATGVDFNAIVDAIALFGENTEVKTLFVHPTMVAKLRRNLKADLVYRTDFVQTGYIGTVAGIDVVMSVAVPEDTAFISTKKAVTCFIKKGTEIEYAARDKDQANKRQNTVFMRKMNVVALTDDREVVKLIPTT